MQVLCLVGAGAEGLALPDAQVRWSCRVAQPGTPGCLLSTSTRLTLVSSEAPSLFFAAQAEGCAPCSRGSRRVGRRLRPRDGGRAPAPRAPARRSARRAPRAAAGRAAGRSRARRRAGSACPHPSLFISSSLSAASRALRCVRGKQSPRRRLSLRRNMSRRLLVGCPGCEACTAAD